MSTADRLPDTQRRLLRGTYIYHVRDQWGRAWWFLTDGLRAVTVRDPLADEDAARSQWLRVVGQPHGGFVRIPGFVRPFEAAEQIAADQVPARPGKGGVS